MPLTLPAQHRGMPVLMSKQVSRAGEEMGRRGLTTLETAPL